MREDKRWLVVGVAGAAHGVRGELRLKSYTEPALGLSNYPALWAGSPPDRKLEIAAARHVKDDMLVVRFKGVDSREAAQALTNAPLAVARADLPAPEEDEFYHADLIGLDAVSPDGERVGVVTALQNFGAGDLLDVRPSQGESFYVPFTRAFVPIVDIEGKRVVLAAEALAQDPDPDGADEG